VPGRDSTVFPLVPRHRLSGLPFGTSHSRRRGRGADVAGSRPYVTGDPMSAIDWRASARLSTARGDDRFVVRERYADEAPRVVILCDRRPSMALYAPPFPWLAKPAAVRAAVDAIVASAIAGRGAAGYLDYADGVRDDPFWIPPRGRAEWQRIGERQEADGRYDAPDDSLALGLDFLSGRRHELPRGSFVFVVSDFLVPPPTDAWLAASARQWDVVPVVVQDPVWEQSFPRIGGVVVPVADPRDGRVRDVRVSRREAEERHRANESGRAELRASFDELGFDPVWLESDDPAYVGLALLEWSEHRLDVRSRR
jgi:uncharacterized protein (DUF58 family)